MRLVCWSATTCWNGALVGDGIHGRCMVRGARPEAAVMSSSLAVLSTHGWLLSVSAGSLLWRVMALLADARSGEHMQERRPNTCCMCVFMATSWNSMVIEAAPLHGRVQLVLYTTVCHR
jgi:hypothetical protein